MCGITHFSYCESRIKIEVYSIVRFTTLADTKFHRFAIYYEMLERLNKIWRMQEAYTDYPKAASENAKAALNWAEKNGWKGCGTAVGKARANQLANREPISLETIERMAAFIRHKRNSNRKLGEGCGRLMWLAWGGDAGVNWAIKKIEQIKNED
jgi:hypothetical protein